MSIKFSSEKDLEDTLFSAPEFLSDEIGISINAELFRQFRLPEYGIVDILSVASEPGTTFIDVIELKNEPLKLQDAAQLARYLNYFRFFSDTSLFEVRGHLIGPTTYPTANDDVFLMQSLSNISAYEFNFDISNGLHISIIDNWRRPNADESDHSWLDEHVFPDQVFPKGFGNVKS